MKELIIGCVLGALMGLILGGMYDQQTPRTHCIQQQWLDTSRGC